MTAAADPPALMQAVMRFVGRTGELLGEWDMWGSGWRGWPEVPWRRSALAFLLEWGPTLVSNYDVCPSVIDRLARWGWDDGLQMLAGSTLSCVGGGRMGEMLLSLSG